MWLSFHLLDSEKLQPRITNESHSAYLRPVGSFIRSSLMWAFKGQLLTLAGILDFKYRNIIIKIITILRK
jgi:hypothetical protein